MLNVPEAIVENSLYHNTLLLKGGLKPFQMDFKGDTNEINGEADPLNFGTGTVFVYDPDGNLVEFIQLGRGIFS